MKFEIILRFIKEIIRFAPFSATFQTKLDKKELKLLFALLFSFSENVMQAQFLKFHSIPAQTHSKSLNLFAFSVIEN